MEEKKECAEKKDIFDRIMACRVFSFARPFYQKYKEILLYVFFGGLTTLVNLAVFFVFTAWIVLDVLLANAIAWVAAVLFAYLTNRTWVFASRAATSGAIIREVAGFFGGRVATLLFEEAVIWLFIKQLGLHAMGIKLAAQVAIVILNYIISKLFVFRKKK